MNLNFLFDEADDFDCTRDQYLKPQWDDGDDDFISESLIPIIKEKYTTLPEEFELPRF